MKKWILVTMAMAMLVPVAGAFQADAIAPAKEGKIPSVAGQFSFGVLNGEAKEHVFGYYRNDPIEVFTKNYTSGKRYQISRLDWDLKDIAMGGVNFSVRPLNFVRSIDLAKDLTFNTANGLTLNFGIWRALTEGNGEMEDFDWLGPAYGLPTDENTHYSLSDVDVTEGYILDLNVSWDFIQWKDIAVGRVFTGYKQNGWSWEDHGKYSIYIDNGYFPEHLNGENYINYEQEFRMPYIGVGVDFTLGDFAVSGYLTYSPSVEATDWDDHVYRDMHYTEEFKDGEMLDLGLDFRYAFSKGLLKGVFLSVAVDVQTIDLIVGDMEYYGAETGGTVYRDNAAGIENSYTVFSLGGGYRF